MTSNHKIRLSALAASLLVLFLTWAAIAAQPWRAAAGATTNDARLVALAQRAHLLRRDLTLVQKLAARSAVAAKQGQLASAWAAAASPSAAPVVKVVTLPPLVITRTS